MPRIKGSLLIATKNLLADERQLDQAGDYPVLNPSDVLPDEPLTVAVDTETSGLYADDGARVAVVSVAWVPTEILTDDEALLHSIETGEGVVSYAFPFDQGVRDKDLPPWANRRYGGGQLDLFAVNDVNLPRSQWSWLLNWLQRQQHDYHNAKFDLEKLRVGTRHWTGRELLDQVHWDSMLTCKEFWPTELVGLKPTAKRLWGEEELEAATALKRWLGPKDDPRYDLVPWNVVGPYAAKDAEQTSRLSWWQRILLDEGQSRPEWVRENFQYMRCLYLMEKRGMPYDAARSLDAVDKLEKVKTKVAKRLPFKPGVNEAKRFYFGPKSTGGLGLRPYSVTLVKREPQLDEEVIRDMEADDVPHIQDYALWRKLDTAQSMWYRAYADGIGTDGRIRTCFRQTDVSSGRISVERFQLQALPHTGKLKLIPEGVPLPRDLFTFPEGREVDLAQAELRVAAVKAECHTMIEQILAGEDIHGNVCTQLFGVTKGDPDWFDLRQVAKRADFSLIFGVGWKTWIATLKKLLGIVWQEDEAKDFIRKWNDLFPEYRRVIRAYDDFAVKNRYVTLANGKKRWFSDYELQYGGHKAFNQYVQPSLAELQKDWTIDTEDRHPGILVMTVHDSQYLDCKPGTGDKVAADIAARGGELGTEMFGIKMEAEWGAWNSHA